HIWGCYAGMEQAQFRITDPNADAELKEYFMRFDLRKPSPGVGRDIAIALDRPVTAVQLLKGKAGGGTEFYYRDPNGVITRTDENLTDRTPPRWMWANKNSRWVTWGPDGKMRPTVRFFNKEYPLNELPSGTPPEWFTSLCQGRATAPRKRTPRRQHGR